MSKVIAIRKARKDDAQEVWDVRNAAILGLCTGYYSQDDLALWTQGELTRKFTEAVEDSFYVAVIDDRVVGTGMIDLESGKLDAIFVHPSFMREGIGRQMLLFLERLARDASLTRLFLDSTLNAAAFYRTCGFVGDAVAKYQSPRGITLACIPMTKTLRTA